MRRRKPWLRAVAGEVEMRSRGRLWSAGPGLDTGGAVRSRTDGQHDTRDSSGCRSRSELPGDGARTMKAIVRDRYGSADALRLSDVEMPDVGDEQVLVRVRAAGLDRGAWHVMAGL